MRLCREYTTFESREVSKQIETAIFTYEHNHPDKVVVRLVADSSVSGWVVRVASRDYSHMAQALEKVVLPWFATEEKS